MTPDGADELLGKKLREEEEKAWNATRMSLKKRGDGTTRGSFTIATKDSRWPSRTAAPLVRSLSLSKGHHFKLHEGE